jgi:hypothetical protein
MNTGYKVPWLWCIGFLITISCCQASIPVLWQTPVNSTSRNDIYRIKLTPDGNTLVVFHYTGYDAGVPGRIEKLDVATGAITWSNSLALSSQRIFLSGWVDASGNLIFGGSYGCYTAWAYDPTLSNALFSYSCSGCSGFEYIDNIAADTLNNLYLGGFTGSSSGDGCRVVKLDSSWNFLAASQTNHTSGKDEYAEGMAFDQNGNLFTVGADRPGNDYNGVQGRIIQHRASDLAETLDVTVAQTDSDATGVVCDSAGSCFVGYSYNLCDSSGQPTGAEQAVIQKRDSQGNVLWEYDFPESGTYLAAMNALRLHTTNQFYVAFFQRINGLVYPGIAEFNFNGQLLWQDTINLPGASFQRAGLEVSGNTILAGLTYTNAIDADQNTNTVVVKLQEETVPACTNLVITPADPSLIAGASQPFTATGYFSDGSSNVLTAANGLVWTTSNPEVATIDTNGLATGLTSGTTTITATDGGVSSVTTLNVVAAPLITNGLVAYYPLNGNAGDASGNGNNGTIYNASFGTDQFGNGSGACQFEGNPGSYIAVTSTGSLNFTNGITFSLWCAVDGIGTQSPRLVSMYTVNGGVCDLTLRTGVTGGPQQIVFTCSTNQSLTQSQQATLTGNFNYGQWVHLVGVGTPASEMLYVNGILVSNVTGIAFGNIGLVNLMSIGRLAVPGYDAFQGRMDNLCIYNRALSASEVQQLYFMGLPITNLVVTPANPGIIAGASQPFTATAYFSDGSSNVLAATNGLVWTTSSPGVATIDTNGLATGLTCGTTTITANSGGASGGTVLKVLASPTNTWVLVPPFNPSTQDVVMAVGNGIHCLEGAAQCAEVFDGKIYFVIERDGTSFPSKIYSFDPARSNIVAVLSETSDNFWSLKAMNGVLWASHINGNLWTSADGVNFSPVTRTPFDANNYVTAMAEFAGRMYFATSAGNIYASSDGSSFNLAATLSSGFPIKDLAVWNGWLYAANEEYYGISTYFFPDPQPSKMFRTADGANWTVLNSNDTFEFFGFVPTTNYLYLASMENPDWASLAFRDTTDGADWSEFFYTGSEGKGVNGHSCYFSQTGRAYYLSNWGGVAELFPVFNGVMENRFRTAHSYNSVIEANGRLFGIGSQAPSNPQLSPFVISLLGNYIHPLPVAAAMTVPRQPDQLLLIPLSDLATNWSDPEGLTVELTSISATTTNGQKVYQLNLTTNLDGSYAITSSAFIGYDGANNLNDQFSYIISDGLGDTNIGYVNIVVSTSPEFGQVRSIANPAGGTVTLNFAGIPGYPYGVQRSTNLLTWRTIWTTNAPGGGLFNYLDYFGDLGGTPPGAAYYRLIWNP